ncbi:MAG: sulfotransferase [Actinomycetes bacterium]
MPLPTFVIVGAQKSGTTTLHDLLGQHPHVWVSDPKELHYFDKYHARGIDWYAEQFRPGRMEVAWGESTPFYLYKDRARQSMAEALESTVFIAILREPVSRAYSQYWFARSKNVEQLSTFAEAIAAEPDRLAAKGDGQPAKGSYLDRGRYYRQLVDLEERVGRHRLMVHLAEDLRAEPKRVLQDTCRFVGVTSDFVEQIEIRERNTFADRTVNSEKGLADADLLRRSKTVPADAYPAIDPSLQAELRARFREDNERLADWLGRDLSAWT